MSVRERGRVRDAATDRRCKGSLKERFMSYVEVADTGCWEWRGYREPKGYGRFAGGTSQLAHRTAYELFVGPIPEGMQLDHLCRNRGCVNPEHLEPVTHVDNIRRGANSLKTHCPQGHPYDRVRIKKNGWITRGCSICEREYFRQRYLDQKAAA